MSNGHREKTSLKIVTLRAILLIKFNTGNYKTLMTLKTKNWTYKNVVVKKNTILKTNNYLYSDVFIFL